MPNSQELQVWHKAMDLILPIYGLTNKFPSDGLLGLINQLRSAAVGTLLNMAEGLNCESEREVVRFLESSRKSAGDCVAELKIALRLKLCPPKEAEELIAQAEEIVRLLGGLISSVGRPAKA